jgi:hypothetical protein
LSAVAKYIHRILVRVKSWEFIADNLSKSGGVGATSQPLIPKDEQSGLLTRIAAESVSLCARMKS